MIPLFVRNALRGAGTVGCVGKGKRAVHVPVDSAVGGGKGEKLAPAATRGLMCLIPLIVHRSRRLVSLSSFIAGHQRSAGSGHVRGGGRNQYSRAWLRDDGVWILGQRGCTKPKRPFKSKCGNGNPFLRAKLGLHLNDLSLRYTQELTHADHCQRNEEMEEK